MTVNRRLISIALALCLMLTLIPSATGTIPSARAEGAGSNYGIVIKDTVHTRVAPEDKIAFDLPINHVCEIRETRVVNKVTWYKIATVNPERKNNDIHIVWIRGDCFSVLTAEQYAQYSQSGTIATPTPIPTNNGGGQPTPTPTPAPNNGKSVDLPAIEGSIGSVTAGGTNFREGPGTGYHSIERLDRNTQVELLTIPSIRGNGNTFFKVRYNGVVGYIMSDFISIISGGPSNGETTVVTPTPAPTNNGNSNNNSNSGSGTTTGSYVKLILSSCHLRNAPDGDYDKDHDWEGRGSTLPLNGSAVQKGGYTWYPVSKDGKTYYVRNDCVEVVNGGATPTETYATGLITPTPVPSGDALGYVRTIKGGCNLRATISGTVIKQIGKNVTLPYLLEPVQKNGYTWYFVADGANRGYLRSDVVKKVSAPDPTATPTPVPDGSVTPTPTPATGLITPTPEPTREPTGYLKTTSGGVNLRKKAGYTDPIGQIAKNVVMPYYGEPTKVKGVLWYNVDHKTLGNGWVHADYVTKCNSDGSAIATPTPAPTNTPEPGTTPAPDGGGAQEATYTTLKTGSTGNAVKNLVTELKKQGYYSGNITNKYTTAVADAVKAFQKAKGLSVDGVAGAATQHKLFGTVPVGAGDTSNLTMTLYPAEKIDWYTGGINELWARGSNYKVYDVKTGIVWWAHRWAGGLHVDAEPLTAADTARLCRCYGVTTSQEIASKNLYQRRPLLVTIGSRTFACSLYGVPHNYPEGDTISTNEFRGQLCIHFTNSRTHNSNKVDSGHEEAIQYAWEHAPNGHQ